MRGAQQDTGTFFTTPLTVTMQDTVLVLANISLRLAFPSQFKIPYST